MYQSERGKMTLVKWDNTKNTELEFLERLKKIKACYNVRSKLNFG